MGYSLVLANDWRIFISTNNYNTRLCRTLSSIYSIAMCKIRSLLYVQCCSCQWSWHDIFTLYSVTLNGFLKIVALSLSLSRSYLLRSPNRNTIFYHHHFTILNNIILLHIPMQNWQMRIRNLYLVIFWVLLFFEGHSTCETPTNSVITILFER